MSQRYPLEGYCQKCGTWAERIVPINMRVCGHCAKRFTSYGATKIVRRIPVADFRCQYCNRYKKAGWAFYVNPSVCERCLMKMKGV